MKTLTYFLITDCFPQRPVGFDALLSNSEAINDCCTLELKFGYSECPIIFFSLHISARLTISHRDSGVRSYPSPIDAQYGGKKLTANSRTLCLSHMLSLPIIWTYICIRLWKHVCPQVQGKELHASHLLKINCSGGSVIKDASCSVKWLEIETAVQSGWWPLSLSHKTRIWEISFYQIITMSQL